MMIAGIVAGIATAKAEWERRKLANDMYDAQLSSLPIEFQMLELRKREVAALEELSRRSSVVNIKTSLF